MISAVILAAGCSRRMGAQKLLLPFAGTTVIAHIADQVLCSPVGQVLVVLREDDDEVAAALAGQKWTGVVNPDPDGDMLSSVRCGLRALPPGCTAVLAVLGDQPSITSGLISEMARALATCGRGIVVPAHAGRRGHPLLFSSRYAEEILTCHQDVGLRGLLQAHPDDVFELDVASSSVLADMDQPADYLRELKRLQENR
jgi:molybdenum cofactor cytidylyltransferase